MCDSRGAAKGPEARKNVAPAVRLGFDVQRAGGPKEDSPGRQPWVSVAKECKARRAERVETTIFRPSGAPFTLRPKTQRSRPGLSSFGPLRPFGQQPLAAGAILCRPSGPNSFKPSITADDVALKDCRRS